LAVFESLLNLLLAQFLLLCLFPVKIPIRLKYVRQVVLPLLLHGGDRTVLLEPLAFHLHGHVGQHQLEVLAVAVEGIALGATPPWGADAVVLLALAPLEFEPAEVEALLRPFECHY